MRSVLAVLGALLLLATTVGGAAAGRPVKESDHIQDIGCDGVATPDGIAYFYAVLSEDEGADGEIVVFDGDPESTEPVWLHDDTRPVAMTFGPTTVEVTIPLLPSGEAQIVADIEPAEDASFIDTGKEGNSRYRFKVTGTIYAVTGTLTLPGSAPAPFGPLDCGAGDVQVTDFFTQPHALVRSFSSTGGLCNVTNADGDTAEVFLDVFPDGLFLNASVTDAGGDQVGAIGFGDVGSSTSMTFDEYDVETGEWTDVQGAATVVLTETGDDFAYVLRASKRTVRVTGSIVDVDGSLTTSLGSFDLDPCVIAMTREKERVNPSNGPKPGGTAPVNDLPAGAIALRVSSKTSTQTRSAQVASEARYPCMEFEDGEGTFTIPVDNTVWYTVTGTGRSITVDTAGSDFDTVTAVYEGAPDAEATVACVDDTPIQPIGRTLQGAATFPTTTGTTYWIQIGGIDESVPGEFDDPNEPYGNLRVAVR